MPSPPMPTCRTTPCGVPQACGSSQGDHVDCRRPGSGARSEQRVHIIITPPPNPNHERAAGAEPRQELQIAAGIAGFVARGRERRGGRPARPERRRQDHGLLHDRRPRRCEQGEIFLDNRDISRLPMHRRAQLGLGYLPQEPSVFRRLSVRTTSWPFSRPGPGSMTRRARRASRNCWGAAHRPRARQPGHEPVGRRAAPGRDRPRPGRGSPSSSCWMSRLPASTPCRSPISSE
jgi:hypothetical protein